MGQRIGRTLRLPRSLAGRIMIVLLVLVAGGGIGFGAALGAPAVLDRLTTEEPTAVVTSPPPEPVAPTPAVQAAGHDLPALSPDLVAAAVNPAAGSRSLGTLTGHVVDPATGATLWARDAEAARVPASAAKLATGAAALLALDHDARLETTVVAGAEPGTVVLVGGGDPTLSGLPDGQASVYPNPARLDDLVEQVRAAVPEGVRRVVVDVQRYQGDGLGPGWLPGDVAAGYAAPIVPVMLDGARSDPAEPDSRRAERPATAAAAELARRLDADPGAVTVGTALPDAEVLGAVQSPPVADLVGTMLRTSDNVLAEALAREVAIATGAEPSFTGAVAAVRQVLAGNGIDTAGLDVVDGSGLSERNRVTAAGLTRLLAAAAAPGADERTARLRPLVTELPVAGGSGTLANRYRSAAERAGRGYVRAKTGTLDGVNSLAGIVVDADGRLMVFALMSGGQPSAVARPALDAVAVALRSCHCG